MIQPIERLGHMERLLKCLNDIRLKSVDSTPAYLRRITGIASISSLCFLVGLQKATVAQLVPDTTLPSNSVVNLSGTTYEITGGSTRGSNLFHSFDEFSVPTDNTAFFNNATAIDRIITRVTGGDRSSIDGLIRANGTADLFLINPNGVIFGPNARLNIGGSFITSTADSIEFADGSLFSASNPSASSLLTVSVPVGLQLGSNPGEINIQGPGHNLGFDPETFVIDRSQRSEGLQVNDGETLTLVGGNITLEGGNLTAPGGRIELGSVGANERINLIESRSRWRLDYRDASQFRDIRLSQAASVDVSSAGSGSVRLRGNQIAIRGGAAILADTRGDRVGRQTLLRAAEKITVSGFSSEVVGEEIVPIFPSTVSSSVDAAATGTGGNLDIRAPRVRVANGGVIYANNLGFGTSGDLTVEAPTRISVRGGIPALGFSSGFIAEVSNAGDGGQLSVNTGRLSVSDGAILSTSTFAEGNSGLLSIEADTVDVFAGAAFLGASSILSSVQFGASGDAGDLVIDADDIFVSGGAAILSSTFGSGSAGDLQVSAQTIDVSGTSPGGNPSGIFAETDESVGNGGNLALNTSTLRVSEGAQISSSTFNAGNAGDLSINAQGVELVGTDANATGLFAAVNSDATGQGGNLILQAESLQVVGGAQVVAGTRGAGNAGLMRISVQDILLSGSDSFRQSGLFASAIVGTGAGGDLQVRGDRLTIENGAVISASNFPSSGNRSGTGQGPAGDIQLAVADIDLLNQGRITASTSTGGRGNITIQSDNLSMLDRSLISTDSQGQESGGNITINTGWLSGFENSDITANAEDSFGGRIVINADLIVGLEFREELTPGNDVTATSELGSEFNGVVEINTTEIEALPDDFPERVIVNPENVVAACEQLRGNELVVTGRGGVPADPSQVLRSQVVWQDWRLAESLTTEDYPDVTHSNATRVVLGTIAESDPRLEGPQFDNLHEETHRTPPTVREQEERDGRGTLAPIEAEGWTKTDSGEIQLVAQNGLATGRGYEGSVVNCQEWR